MTYDPIIIDYEDEHNFEADDELSEQKKLTNYVYYDEKFGSALSKIELDDGYELETVAPWELKMLEMLRNRFGERGFEPIPFYDLRAAMYKIGEKLDRRVSKFDAIHCLRHLWRYGELQRFVKGRNKFSTKRGRGEWYGVHYILYPESITSKRMGRRD